jgi:hypothetical protein
MNSKGLTIIDMDDDGNCLFRAVADHLYGSQDDHLILRHQIFLEITSPMKRAKSIYMLLHMTDV